MRHLRAVAGLAGLAILGSGCGVAVAQDALDVRGTWIPAQGAHIVSGPSRHRESGTQPVAGEDGLATHTSKFVFHFDGQEGRTFWGSLSSAKVSEDLIGALSVDSKRFVMTDQDGMFDGRVVDADTLEYCYKHVTPTDMAVACGMLLRQK